MRGTLAWVLIGLVASACACGDDTQPSTPDAGIDAMRADGAPIDGAPIDGAPVDLSLGDQQADQPSGTVETILGWIETTPIAPAKPPVPAVGLSVTIYDQSDLTKPLASGTTDASGKVKLTSAVSVSNFVAHAKGAGYRDIWVFTAHPTSAGEFLNLPISTEVSLAGLFTSLGETELSTHGIVAAEGAAGGDLSSLTTTVTSGGKTFYVGAGDVPDPQLKNARQSITVNVPAGPTTVKLQGSGTALTGQRDVTVFPGALTLVLIPVN